MLMGDAQIYVESYSNLRTFSHTKSNTDLGRVINDLETWWSKSLPAVLTNHPHKIFATHTIHTQRSVHHAPHTEAAQFRSTAITFDALITASSGTCSKINLLRPTTNTSLRLYNQIEMAKNLTLHPDNTGERKTFYTSKSNLGLGFWIPFEWASYMLKNIESYSSLTSNSEPGTLASTSAILWRLWCKNDLNNILKNVKSEKNSFRK